MSFVACRQVGAKYLEQDTFSSKILSFKRFSKKARKQWIANDPASWLRVFFPGPKIGYFGSLVLHVEVHLMVWNWREVGVGKKTAVVKT
eukprot:767726-Hanusia_phi.AAC.2